MTILPLWFGMRAKCKIGCVGLLRVPHTPMGRVGMPPYNPIRIIALSRFAYGGGGW